MKTKRIYITLKKWKGIWRFVPEVAAQKNRKVWIPEPSAQEVIDGI